MPKLYTLDAARGHICGPSGLPLCLVTRAVYGDSAITPTELDRFRRQIAESLNAPIYAHETGAELFNVARVAKLEAIADAAQAYLDATPAPSSRKGGEAMGALSKALGALTAEA